MADRLKYNEMPVDRIAFNPKEELTPEKLEFLFCCMSEEQQDTFLSKMKEVLDEKSWEALVIHLKSYDLQMMGEYREKGKLLIDTLGVSLYDYFINQSLPA